MVLNELITPLTFADSIEACLSQSHGTAGASSVIDLSMSAPRRPALRDVGHQLRLRHRVVDRRHVQLRDVVVGHLEDVVAVVERVEQRLAVGEVLAPGHVGADGDLRGRDSGSTCRT